MDWDREIRVKDNIALLVLSSGTEGLSTHVNMQFPYINVEGEEKYVSALSEFVLVNQADKSGLRHTKNDHVRMLLQVAECPGKSERDYSDLIGAGMKWLQGGTKESPRSLAVPNAIVLGKFENIVESYLWTYVNRFMKENQFAVDTVTHSMKGIAQLAFDPNTPQGQWRIGEDRTITMYGGNHDTIKKISNYTHPGQLMNSVNLL